MYELLSGDALPPHAEITPTNVRQYLTEVAAEEARRNLRIFCKRGWTQLQPQKLIWNWHADAICLPAETLITTEYGPMAIGDMVNGSFRGKALSYCHDSGRAEWRPVTKLMRTPSQPLLNIDLGDHGRLQITGNHPVFVEDRGYVRADLLRPGDVVLHLHSLQQAVQSPKKQAREILQPAMLRQAESPSGSRYMSFMRRSQGVGINTLPPMLRQEFTAWCGATLPSMRQALLYHPWPISLFQAYSRRVLQQGLLCQIHHWASKSPLQRWVECHDVSEGLSGYAQGNQSSRWTSLLPMSRNWKIRRTSHRSVQEEQRTMELGYALQAMPRHSARRDPTGNQEVGRAHVQAVECSLRICDALYNLEVGRNHNYFANGILVHNCDHLAYVTLGEIRFLMVSIGPRMSKTMLISVLWPDWHWLHEPGEQFLTAGVDDQLARDASILSRRLIEGPWFKAQYPGEIELFDDENTAGMYRNHKGGYRMIGSLQGRITGVGGSIQILDDPHDAKKIEGDKVRHNALAWHDNAWRSRLNNPDTAKKVYVGQRTHDMDIFGHVLEQEGNRWCHLILPMEFDSKRRCITFLNKGDGATADAKPIFQDPRTVDNEILDPKRMSAKTVNAEKRVVSEAAWQAQYNQRPTGTGGLILKRHWWRPWIQPEWRTNSGTARPMPRFDEIIQVWDTALEEDEVNDADFSACTTWGTFLYREQFLDKETNKPVSGSSRVCAMLLDGVKERYSFPDLRQKAVDLNKEFAPSVILVEKKVSGHSLVQELRRKNLPVKAVKLSGSSGKGGREGDLVARAMSASLMLEKGCIWYPPMPFSYEVMEECSKFPNGDHDDFVSTCVIAWMYLRRYHDLQLPDDERDEVSPWAWKTRPTKRYA